MPPPRAHALLAPGASSSSSVSAHLPGREQLPPVDERLLAPETPFEIVDGKVIEVMGSHEPHATATSQLAYVLGASVSQGFRCAVDMLTRADRFSDVAPDASVFPVERDPETGHRQLEHLVFEVRDSQPLADVTRKAQLLSERGVRRIFCLEVEGARVLEWTRGEWLLLGDDDAIDDALCLVSPLPVRALLSAADADNAAASALLTKKNPVLEQALERRERRGEQRGRRDGRADGLRDGRADGLRDGRADGLRDGRAEGLREAIAAICQVLQIELDDSRRNHINRLDASGLSSLLNELAARRQWPLPATGDTDAPDAPSRLEGASPRELVLHGPTRARVTAAGYVWSLDDFSEGRGHWTAHAVGASERSAARSGSRWAPLREAAYTGKSGVERPSGRATTPASLGPLGSSEARRE
jgi:hypothetical protein